MVHRIPDFTTVGDVMTDAPLFIEEQAPLLAARTLLLRERIHHLPVVRRHRRPVGLLTDRDLHLVTYLASDLVSDDEITAGDICVPDPYVVGVSTPLAEVLDIMAHRHLGAAMVVDNDELVGIFTSHDACRLLARMQDRRALAPMGAWDPIDRC